MSYDELEVEAKAYFEMADRDGSMTLTADELKPMCSKVAFKSLKCFPKMICRVFGTNDAISYDQFLEFWRRFRSEDGLDFVGERLFKFIDKDGSGKVDPQEAQEAINLIDGCNCTLPSDIKGLTYDEFKRRFLILVKMRG